ncbi:TetR/AcrR family transcriptional regulator [[Mycobacterium] vasticus]|uniref:TetR/AcrR family transcriptional regulator C-terminal domain-containing protein n=1 Tax=[Mycobacterium] vasticus TaxID=2875777 RepID=A0ABU5Z2S0_9MYCO|nr:TetR/AcrR family transcriptional regulator C-terminal domain-containing protein [Mycolicibacter sp. MYC017]MEB3071695.1 TetR/AcrR family transcriptional regulator C-terminal domain-containing protein [Mycolicibacter sp. MYC017]
MTEEEIVGAALSVIRTEGVNALSMRRLSAELGRSTMATYRYVTDKQALLDLVARKVLAEVPIPPADSGPWDARLRELISGIDDRMRHHTGIAEILLERMLSTDYRVMAGVMDILQSAGFSERDVLLAYAMIHTYLFGRYQVVMHAGEIDESPSAVPESMRTLQTELPKLRGQDFFTFGVDTIIQGLRGRLGSE